jgi:hypothetical protein
VASLLLPGLGHVLMGRFGRALIWLGGTLAIAFIIREESSDMSTQLLVLQAAVNVFAAIDICLLIKTQGPAPRRR